MTLGTGLSEECADRGNRNLANRRAQILKGVEKYAEIRLSRSTLFSRSSDPADVRGLDAGWTLPEISTEGMKLELREPLSPNSCGRVRLSYLNFRLELPVRVAHSGASYDGVKFVYESDEQRDVNRWSQS